MDEDPNKLSGIDAPAAADPVVLNYAPTGAGRMQLLAALPTEGEAHLAAGLLEAQGLECKVVTRLPTYALGPHSGALLVAECDMPGAVEILASTPARAYLHVPASELPPAKVLTVEVCPACGSPDIAPARRWHWILFAIGALAWIPWVIPSGEYWYVGLLMFGSMLILTTRSMK
jgi:hypothetical protein